MKNITVDPQLVSYCGLYCGACKSHRKGRCPGCHENRKAGWCKIRTCNQDHGYTSCADCGEFADAADCRKFDNLFSRLIGLVLNSDRRAGVEEIRKLGLEGFASAMAERGRVAIKRR